MTSDEIVRWAKAMESRKTYELVSLGVTEVKIEKGKGTLKAMRERLDIMKKDEVKHERFRKDNDQSLVQLNKWGFPLPKEEKERLIAEGLISLAPPPLPAASPTSPAVSIK